MKIAIAAGDADLAAEACSELEDIAAAYGTSGLEVMARQARGWWLPAAGRRAEALPVLRHACQQSQELGAPYECARTRVLLAHAYRALGDADTAALEQLAASAALQELGPRCRGRRRARPPGVPSDATSTRRTRSSITRPDAVQHPALPGLAAVLVRLVDVALPQLAELLEDSYGSRAPKRLLRTLKEGGF